MSAAHIDWFEKDEIKFCAILDDASRKILAAGEFKNANTENSIALVDKLVEDYWSIMPLEELTTEVSSELTERMVKRNGTADSSVTLNRCA